MAEAVVAADTTPEQTSEGEGRLADWYARFDQATVSGVPVLGHKIKSLEKLRQCMAVFLPKDEPVVAVFAANGIRPMYSHVAVTGRRVVAFELTGAKPVIHVPLADIADRSATVQWQPKTFTRNLPRLDFGSIDAPTRIHPRHEQDEAIAVAAVTWALERRQGQPEEHHELPNVVLGRLFPDVAVVLGATTPILVAGERVTGLFTASRDDRHFNAVAMTTHRIMAFNRSSPAEDRIEVGLSEVDQVLIGAEASGRSVVAVLNGGTSVWLANLVFNDTDRLRDLWEATSDAPSLELVVPAHVLRSEALHNALQSGFPGGVAHMFSELRRQLDDMRRHAADGDIVGEEQRRHRLVTTTSQIERRYRGPLTNWITREIEKMEARSELRLGSSYLDAVKPTRSWTDLIGGRLPNLELFSDRAIYGGRAYPIDGNVTAAMELDGQIFERSRTSLTNTMLFGMAFAMTQPKTDRSDQRVARFFLVHPDWNLVQPVPPDDVPHLRAIAARINSITGALANEGKASRDDQWRQAVLQRLEGQPRPTIDWAAYLDNVERLKKLVASGAMSVDEAEALKIQMRPV